MLLTKNTTLYYLFGILGGVGFALWGVFTASPAPILLVFVWVLVCGAFFILRDTKEIQGQLTAAQQSCRPDVALAFYLPLMEKNARRASKNYSFLGCLCMAYILNGQGMEALQMTDKMEALAQRKKSPRSSCPFYGTTAARPSWPWATWKGHNMPAHKPRWLCKTRYTRRRGRWQTSRPRWKMPC